MGWTLIWCALFDHDWQHQPGMIPEDRATYECQRCGEYTMVPPSVGQPLVPEEQRDQ